MESRNGFVLAELITAMFVIMVLFAVTASVIFMCSDHVRRTHNFLLAKQIASNRLEMMRCLPFDDLDLAASEGESFTSPLSKYLTHFQGTVSVGSFDDNTLLKKITVSIRWKEKQQTRELSLWALRSKRTQ